MGARKKRTQSAETAFRLTVLKRASHACERCGSTQNLHAHHRVPRSRGGTHEPDNGHCLCGGCHALVHDHRIDDWRDWIE